MEQFAVVDLNTKYDLYPTNDKIVVRREEKTQTKSGLVMPDNMKGNNVLEGEIVAVGPGAIVMGDATKRHSLQVKVGQKILFNRHSGTEIEINGEKLIVMHENDVMVVMSAKRA